MRLLYTPTSPYARKVRITLLEKHLACELVLVATSDASLAHANPLGKVPALLRDDGVAVYDSPVIVAYLEALAPTPSVYLPDPMARVEVCRWEALADGVCDATVARMLEGRRDQPDARAAAHQERKIVRGLEVMEQELGDRDYAVGGTFTLADISVAVTIGYVGLRAPELLRPALVARYERLCERASLAETVPPR